MYIDIYGIFENLLNYLKIKQKLEEVIIINYNFKLEKQIIEHLDYVH
jgi:hypothetical protein